MSDVILIVSASVGAVCALVLLFFCFKLMSMGMKRMDSEMKYIKMRGALTILDDIIKSSVIETNQALVNSLKRADNFLQMDREEAFEETRTKVYSIIKEDNLGGVKHYIANIEEFINSRIEYHVNMENSKYKV